MAMKSVSLHEICKKNSSAVATTAVGNIKFSDFVIASSDEDDPLDEDYSPLSSQEEDYEDLCQVEDHVRNKNVQLILKGWGLITNGTIGIICDVSYNISRLDQLFISLSFSFKEGFLSFAILLIQSLIAVMCVTGIISIVLWILFYKGIISFNPFANSLSIIT